MLLRDDVEFPRIDDRLSMKEHTQCFFDVMDPRLGANIPAILPVMGGGYPPYNSVGHYNMKTKKLTKYFAGLMHFVQELVFVPLLNGFY